MSVLTLISDMFLTPGTPDDAYSRMAAAWGHGMVGAVLTSLFACAIGAQRLFASALICTLAYALFWEGAQIAFAGGDIFDFVTDTAAVFIGGLIVWAPHAARRGLLRPLALAVSLIILGALRPRGQK